VRLAERLAQIRPFGQLLRFLLALILALVVCKGARFSLAQANLTIETKLQGVVMRKVLGMLLLLALTGMPSVAQTQPNLIRIKCGGPAYTDSKHQAWAADYDSNGGLVSQMVGPVSGTPDAALYQHGRMPNDTEPLIYTFPLPNGAYHVNLYFAELNPGDEHVGGRVFNVKLQGNPVIQDLDIFKTVGANAALTLGSDIAVTKSEATIELDNIPGHDRGKVTAIEITQTQPAPELIMNFTYPDGTPVNGTLSYTMSTSALKLGGNAPLVDGQASCVLFAAPQILGLVGQIQLNLSLTDTAGHQLWQIGMTMDPTNINFGSIQKSSLNVTVQKL
jgi:Malectin domain